MKLVLIVLTLIPMSSNAAEYKQFFLVGTKQVSAEEAILASLKGNEAYRCVSVESKLSKAGTSIGLRQVKKPRAGAQ